jgi:hypothetical protein
MESTGAFPLGMVLREEMEARGWTEKDIEARCTDPVAVLAIGLVLAVYDPNLILDEHTAEALGQVFGVSAKLFLNIDHSYRQWCAETGKRVDDPHE